MTINEKLIELINEDKSVNEISTILNLSNKQIYSRIKTLKSIGYNIKNKYLLYFVNLEHLCSVEIATFCR